MSRHSKRISVFDRLGPDNERDSSSHLPPPPPLPHPPPVRHRHYPDKHGVPDDRSRDKRESDRISRKRRHGGFDDDPMSGSPMESRPTKRDKPVLPNSRRSDPRERLYSEKSRRIRSSTSHSSTEGGDGSDEEKRKLSGHTSSIKRTKSQRELGRHERSVDDKMMETTERKDSDYGHGDDERSRRKRERESASEGEESRDNKRRKMEDNRKGPDESGHHYHRDGAKLKEKKVRRNESTSQSKSVGGRKRSLYDSFSESEAEHHGIQEVDWFTLAKIPMPKVKDKKESVLNQFKAGAFLSKIGVSAALAGEEMMSKVEGVITEHLMDKYGNSDGGPLFDVGVKFGSSLALHIEEQIANRSLISNIGSCRRALVASVDFDMRKKLRNLKKGDSDIIPSTGPPPSTWDPDLYSSSVSLYQSDNNNPIIEPPKLVS